MNQDQVSGKVDQATGKVKEKTGEALGDQRMADEGRADQVKGIAKEAWGNAKDTGKKIVDALDDKGAQRP